jgi:hypothetical protein
VSKQAKDAARKKAAAAMREVVSKQGKAYDRVVRELDRDQYREYVLSVKHSPAGDADPEPVLSDWLPVCEVIVADKQQYEARKFFKENNMDIPETEQQSVSAEQIEGVPAIKAAVPKLGADLLAMAAAMAGLERAQRRRERAGVWRRGLGQLRKRRGWPRGASRRRRREERAPPASWACPPTTTPRTSSASTGG